MSDGDRWGVIDTISCRLLFDQAFEHVLRTDGTFTDAHLFVCPLQVASHEPRFTLALPESGHYHWALDSTRNTRMSLENSDALSLPRFRFELHAWGTFWEAYHYNAVQEFHEANGFDADSLDVASLLELPLVQMNLPPKATI